MVCRLDNELWFPDPHYGDDDGCIAVGGDLSVDRLLLAYQHGIFPWYSFRYDEPTWFCPMERFVIFPNEIHVSHSMRTLMNKDLYRLSFNEDFEGVIEQCSQLRIDEDYAWLGPDMKAAYTELHHQGFAASVEVWEPQPDSESQTSPDDQAAPDKGKERLVGGLYGVNIGSAFFGESMFSLVPSASKLALIHLARTLQQIGGSLIDCQFETAHLKSMGGRFISYDDYMRIISSD
jgi:leucyl/phenylalanyl-tRNA--protein transferase